MHTAKY